MPLTEVKTQPLDSVRIPKLIREVAEPISDIERGEIDSLIERAGAARVVLIGEASHGTSEFYRMRARITRELIERKGFNIVAIEGDWPDAARINNYIQRNPSPTQDGHAFTRFPTWMWRNREVAEFIGWLRGHNDRVGDPNLRVGFYGLDLYSLYGSINAVIDYLDKVDPDEARIARDRYACFSPWKPEASSYGRAALLSSHHLCREEAIAMLRDLFAKRLDYIQRDGERFWDAIQNARLITDAERYYRVMYHGATESWNLRDQHMFETLDGLLGFRGSEAKAVVWAHNSHVGDALASEMGVRGELNIGFLARQKFGSGAYLVGFGTDHGTVAAATDWGGPMKIKDVRPAQQDSYERLCHDSGVAAFLLHFRDPLRSEVIEELLEPRLERAIGVIYRPDTERASHYFYARLPQQFDSYIWFDHTTAVCPLPVPKGQETDTHPLGLESGVSGQQPTSAECR